MRLRFGTPASSVLTISNHGVAHVYNDWSHMLPIAEQHRQMLGVYCGVHGAANLDAVEDVL